MDIRFKNEKLLIKDLELARDYIYEYNNGQNVNMINNHVTKRKYILGVYISLFLFYCHT